MALGLVAFVGWTAVGHARGRDLWLDLQARPWGRWLAVAAVLMVLGWGYKLAIVRGW